MTASIDQSVTSTCKRCDKALVSGVALLDDVQIPGVPDFFGGNEGDITAALTCTAVSSGKRHYVLKCPACGASYGINQA